MHERERLIRIPRSGARNSQPQFAKLLTRVSPKPQSGFDFAGMILRPGRIVPEKMLRPPGFPETPLVLECAGIVGGKGHNRGECQYILWQLEGTNWMELGRAQSQSWEWSLDLAPIAARALDAGRTQAIAEVITDITRVQRKFSTMLDKLLEPLAAVDRQRLLSGIHDHLASRFASGQAVF